MNEAQWRRFEPKFQTEPNTGCWLWIGSLTKGYGYFGRGRRGDNVYAHRFSFEHFHGKIPKGKRVLHRCDTPVCVNPDHLFLGTQRDNIHDMLRKNRGRWRSGLPATCGRGHAFTPENTRPGKNGSGRSCRTCERDRWLRKTAESITTLSLVLATSACAGGPVPVYWVDSRVEDRHPYQAGDPIPEIGSFDRIAEACAFWGLDCFETEDSERVLTIWLSTHGGSDSGDDYLCGETSHADPCAPLIFSCDDDRVLEHEIGHALGSLKHRKHDTDNVMHPNADLSGYSASDWQIDRVQAGGDKLWRCHERGWAAR